MVIFLRASPGTGFAWCIFFLFLYWVLCFVFLLWVEGNKDHWERFYGGSSVRFCPAIRFTRCASCSLLSGLLYFGSSFELSPTYGPGSYLIYIDTATITLRYNYNTLIRKLFYLIINELNNNYKLIDTNTWHLNILFAPSKCRK